MSEARRFARVLDFLGEGGFRKVHGATVTVVGLGGVGSHAAIALARSGVGKLILVDFDRLTETSLNRNPLAAPEDCGGFKVDVIADSLRKSCPDTAITVHREFFHAETAGKILEPLPDALIDAIDSLNPKTALVQECLSRGIPLFSSMGASGRRDPTLVRVGDISETRGCPLARQLRKYLRKRGIERGFKCVFSVEPSGDHALPPDQKDVTLERGRTRNRIPSLVTMPGIFGYTLAAMVLEHLSGTARE
jgi:tRNA threonylcarbamoyladenosine dehydratase